MPTAAGLLSSRTVRVAILGLIASIPLLTLWNIAAATYAPRLQITFGQPLRGVTQGREPIQWSLKAFADGSLQEAIADTVSDALPARPLLIRLSNSFRKRLFGIYGAPGVIEGRDGQLIEEFYLREYCRRDLAKLHAAAPAWVARLKALQDFYESRGKIFVYLITPSKVAHMPEKFTHLAECASAKPDDGANYLPAYRRMLTEAGVRTVDTASLTHSLRGRYEIELFPLGGVHWNQIGVARATEALLAEIDRAAGRPTTQHLKWNYTVTDRPRGEDTDLFDIVNLIFARPRYATATVQYDNGRSCEEFTGSKLKVALIGGSFTGYLGRLLITTGCLTQLERYNYLFRGRQAGPELKDVLTRVTATDILPLRDVDLVILEENEAMFPSSRHAAEFARVMLGD